MPGVGMSADAALTPRIPTMDSAGSGSAEGLAGSGLAGSGLAGNGSASGKSIPKRPKDIAKSIAKLLEEGKEHFAMNNVESKACNRTWLTREWGVEFVTGVFLQSPLQYTMVQNSLIHQHLIIHFP